jgi:hypothetical protein
LAAGAFAGAAFFAADFAAGACAAEAFWAATEQGGIWEFFQGDNMSKTMARLKLARPD